VEHVRFLVACLPDQIQSFIYFLINLSPVQNLLKHMERTGTLPRRFVVSRNAGRTGHKKIQQVGELLMWIFNKESVSQLYKFSIDDEAKFPIFETMIF
jgi:hypothetical protein